MSLKCSCLFYHRLWKGNNTPQAWNRQWSLLIKRKWYLQDTAWTLRHIQTTGECGFSHPLSFAQVHKSRRHCPLLAPLAIRGASWDNQVPVERESIYFSQQHHIVRDGAQWRVTTFPPTTGTSRIKDEKIHRANCSHVDTGGHHQKIMSFFFIFLQTPRLFGSVDGLKIDFTFRLIPYDRAFHIGNILPLRPHVLQWKFPISAPTLTPRGGSFKCRICPICSHFSNKLKYYPHLGPQMLIFGAKIHDIPMSLALTQTLPS